MKLAERTNAALTWIEAQLALCNAATESPWVALALLALQEAILALREIEANGFCHTEKAMDFILSKIEDLQGMKGEE
jgi:hypothetical protein